MTFGKGRAFFSERGFSLVVAARGRKAVGFVLSFVLSIGPFAGPIGAVRVRKSP
jgi:hypothetical protein